MAVERFRVAVGLDRRLALLVGAGARLELLVDPGAVQELHQRPVQHVDPDHRLRVLVAVVVPGAVRRQDDVAAGGFAALALDIGVAALGGQDGAAGVRRVHVRRCDVAGIVDRDRAADGVGDHRQRDDHRSTAGEGGSAFPDLGLGGGSQTEGIGADVRPGLGDLDDRFRTNVGMSGFLAQGCVGAQDQGQSRRE